MKPSGFFPRRSIAVAASMVVIIVSTFPTLRAQGLSSPAGDSRFAGEARFALVIGNGSYANSPLKNPPNDAQDMAETLGSLGFQVNLLVDGDLAAMNRAVRDFGNLIRRPDAVALFYYSGYGI